MVRLPVVYLLILQLTYCVSLLGNDPLPRTASLEQKGDLASDMLEGIDRFLLKEIANSSKVRDQNWATIDLTNEATAAGSTTIESMRQRLAAMLGVVDNRIGDGRIEFIEDWQSLIQPKSGIPSNSDSPITSPTVRFIRWPVLDSVWGEGMLVEPSRQSLQQNFPTKTVIVIPDADQTPEQLAGLTDGVAAEHQWARILALSGCRVFVPALINRQVVKRGPPGEEGRAELSNREYVYRPSFEMGRHVIGYEIQQILALVDIVARNPRDSELSGKLPRSTIAVAGYGEGGLVALMASALDTRIESTLVSGYFGPRENSWTEPICRNLFGQLNHFSDAEVAALVHPRELLIDFRAGPTVSLRTQGGAPGNLRPQTSEASIAELQRLFRLTGKSLPAENSGQNQKVRGIAIDSPGYGVADHWILDEKLEGTSPLETLISSVGSASLPQASAVVAPTWMPDNNLRQRRLVGQLIDHTQRLLYQSTKVRKKFFAQLDTQSLDAYEKTCESYRQSFSKDVIGQFDHALLPPSPRTRKSWEKVNWTGYEVMLDVFPDVVAYGVLLLPKNIKPDEKRPVVVCQHGLEGRPTDVFEGDHNAYHDYAAKLCERGYIVFAPQNIYIFQDRFRSLQRKANPLGKTLFSIMVPQHQQIVNWLKTLPNVDSQRIAFYGLSYGGKSAMRIPALVKDYCLSICSADFNEWIVKNASTTHSFSYVWTGEYEIFEFNLGNTFNYAEMAALICPRPFMVERGHFDGVGEDEWVGFEFAKVKNLYQAKLGIGDRAEIEWFQGPHTIHGIGTFEFLDRFLLNQ